MKNTTSNPPSWHYTNPKGNYEMVLIPGGESMMGSEDAQAYASWSGLRLARAV